MSGAPRTSELRPGTLVSGRYRVDRLLGSGGFASVFEATTAKDGTRVALKVLEPDALAAAGGAQRAVREAELASRLQHPNVVRVLDAGTAPDGTLFIAFELLEGRSLEAEIERAGALAPPRAVRIAIDVLSGLEEAHRLGIVHRDLKPANVFLLDGQPERVKIVDFGIAKSTNPGTLAGLTRDGIALGTPAYMSPEQIVGGEIGPASDLFSLGIVLAEALTGRPPHDGASSAIDMLRERLNGQPFHMTDALRRHPLGAVVERATQTSPRQRFGSAAEMRAALEAIAPSLTGQPLASVFPPAARPPAAGAALTGPALGAIGYLETRAAPTPSPPLRPSPQAGGYAAAQDWRAPGRGSSGPSALLTPAAPARRAPGLGVVAVILAGLLVLAVAAALLFVHFARQRHRGSALGPGPTTDSPAAATGLQVVRCERGGSLGEPTLRSHLLALGWEITGTLVYCSGDMVNFRCLGPEGRGFTVRRDATTGSVARIKFTSASELDAFLRSEQNGKGERTIAHEGLTAMRLEMPRADADRVVARACK